MEQVSTERLKEMVRYHEELIKELPNFGIFNFTGELESISILRELIAFREKAVDCLLSVSQTF